MCLWINWGLQGKVFQKDFEGCSNKKHGEFKILRLPFVADGRHTKFPTGVSQKSLFLRGIIGTRLGNPTFYDSYGYDILVP